MILDAAAFALGRCAGTWSFLSPELRLAAQFSAISGAWVAFRKDAGAGGVGRHHEGSTDEAALLATSDSRRDGVLLWLADHGMAGVAEAAALLARATGARHRFDDTLQATLDAARDALGRQAGGAGVAGGTPLASIRAAIDRLRRDPEFGEASGHEAVTRLPAGTLRHYVPAAPGATWALNLALLAKGSPLGAVPITGLVSRAQFRAALSSDERDLTFGTGVAAACDTAFQALGVLDSELRRGATALAHLSRNARAAQAWSVVAALGSISRSQLARILGLSRAGADIQAHALHGAGLVDLLPGGRIVWCQRRPVAAPAPIDQGPLGGAISDLDASMAEIDRLLAKAISEPTER